LTPAKIRAYNRFRSTKISLKNLFQQGTVKKVMKNHSEEYGKTRETLPLEGGGKRVGVKGLTRDALLTPHPDPLPQGERGDNF
jgi:hypothetical protein